MDTIDAFLGKKPKQQPLPEAVIPAAPAPDAKVDAGAKVVIGTDAKDKRNSGTKTTGTGTSTGSANVLGNLGRGGLSI